jgi:transposase-like protein
MEAAKHAATRRYPPELRERAGRMVFEAYEHSGERHGVITRIAAQLGVGTESLAQLGEAGLDRCPSRRSTDVASAGDNSQSATS